jgi:hypothetical protein
MRAPRGEQRIAANECDKLHARAEDVSALLIQPRYQFAVFIKYGFHRSLH